jgi:hypothetical protein
MLRHARELKAEEPCPELAQYQGLLVNKETSKEELTLQLIIILSRWGLLEVNEDDRKIFLSYLCSMWRKPDIYVAAAEEALARLFTNWVLPQDWKDFRRYAKQTVWAHYAKGARGPTRGGVSPAWARCSTNDWAESVNERKRRGKGGSVISSGHLSVPQLAWAAQMDPRRIYEAIKAGDLPAARQGPSLRIDRESATRYLLEAKQRREIAELREQIYNMGVGKDAVRKKIYRLRRDGASDMEIIDYLKEKASRLS